MGTLEGARSWIEDHRGTTPKVARYFSVAALIGSVGIAAAGFGIDHLARIESRHHLEADLRSTLQGRETAVRTWLSDMRTLVAGLARERHLIEATDELLGLHRGGRVSPAALADGSQRVAAELAPLVEEGGFVEYLLFAPSGLCLAATHTAHVGQGIDPGLRPWFDRALAGEVAVTPPRPLSLSERPTGDHAERPELLLVSAPISREAGPPLALLVLTVPPARAFTPLLSIGVLEEQAAETYAFDADGRMLTHGRHLEELRERGVGGLEGEGATGLVLRDPGGDLLAGFEPTEPEIGWPLVRPVARALAEGAGVDVNGYRSYTGRWVIGAWTWLPEYGFGVVVERGREAAFAHHRMPRFAISFASGLALVCAFAGLATSWAFARLPRAAAQTVLGSYELIRLLDRGGMAEVYLARHALLRRPTAVKLIRERDVGARAIQRFEREIAAMARLSHPNVVSIYDHGRTEDGTLYYAMEYLRGFDLQRLVKRHGPLPEARALVILARVASALTEAHGTGLVHRDLSPRNVMLCELGGIPDFVKVLDFGLVRDVGASGQSSTGEVAGTPCYMAPESFDRPRDAAPSVDIYSLGALGYYLITATPPFLDANPFVLYTQHRDLEVESPSQRLELPVDPDLEAVLMRCLEKDPARRYASARELEEALRSCRAYGRWTRRDAEAWWVRHAEALLGTGSADHTATVRIARADRMAS